MNLNYVGSVAERFMKFRSTLATEENVALNIFNAVLLVIAVLTPILRLISGVHWFTDIIGGILISIAMLATFYNVLMMDLL